MIVNPENFAPHTNVNDDDEEILQILEGLRENEGTPQMVSDALDAEYPSDISPIKVNITEVLKPGDPRGKNKKFLGAEKNEIMGLKKRNVWKVVHK